MRALLIAPLALVGAALTLLFGFELAYWDRVTPGVKALGVDVGGMTVQAAAARLQPRAAEALDRPLILSAGTWERRTTPRELGLRLDSADIARTAAGVGRSGNPLGRLLEQLDALVRGRSLDALGEQDQGAMEAYLGRLAAELNRPPRDAVLSLGADYRPRLSASEQGRELDVKAAAQAVSRALAQREERVTLPLRETEPARPNALLRPAFRELESMLAGPVSLAFQQRQWRLELADLAAILGLELRHDAPALVRIDQAALRKRLDGIAGELNQEPRDARFDWTRTGLKVLRESREGRKLDVEEALKATIEGIRAGERQISLPVRVTPPAVSSADPAQLGIKELIEHTKTSFSGSIDEKKHNIALAAERLNGVVVPPGGLFSFNRAVGATTLEAGFKWGFGITSAGDGVKTVPSVAGGICQVATTLFQSVFWAGYQLEERHWHLYWIPAYTSREVVGLDVTVDEESGLDFQWINPTPHYVLVQAWTEKDELHFALYGQKPAWKVEVDPPVITDRVPPEQEMVFESAPTLAWGRKLAVETAREGFHVVVVRRVTADGDVRTLQLKSTYKPSRNVTLVGTQGAPPGQVEALLADLRADSAQNKPVKGEDEKPGENGAATPKPASQPTPKPNGQPTPKPGAQPTATPAAKPAQKTQVPATATPASKPARTEPTPAPKAPTPTPKSKD
jgi:vancomycin resistance protein YoaR